MIDFNSLVILALEPIYRARTIIFGIFIFGLIATLWYKMPRDLKDLIIEMIKDILFKPFK